MNLKLSVVGLLALAVSGVTAKGAANLPKEYAALAYIESTGSQYINTGYVPTSATGVEAVYELRSYGEKRNYIVGSCTSSGACRFQLSPMGSELLYGWGSASADALRCLAYREKMGVHTAKLDRGIFTTDGILDATLAEGKWVGTGQPLHIFSGFSGEQASNFSKIRLYSLQIFESGSIVRDYQPCVRLADGKAGLYDRLASPETAFLVNGGAEDDFVKGPFLDVPSGYERRTYIESSGSQYIDTGYKPNGKTVATFKYRLLKTNQNRNYVIGYCNAGSDGKGDCRFQYAPPGSGSVLGYGPSTYAYPSAAVEVDSLTDHTVTMSADGLVYDGSRVVIFDKGWKNTSNYGLIVFSTHTDNATPSAMSWIRLYGLTLSEDGEVVHDYVPCVRTSDGVAGLYDLTVTDGTGFLSNQNAADGAAPFAASAAVPATCKISGWPYNCGAVTPGYGVWEGAFDGVTPVTFSAPARVTVRDPELVEKCIGYEIRTNGVVSVAGSGTSVTLTDLPGDDAEIVWKWTDVGKMHPGYQSVITLPKVVTTNEIENLPVLIRLSSSRIAGFSYDQLKNGQDDILIRGADGQVLPHDVDTWNESGESLVWVRVPSVDAEGARVVLNWRLSGPIADLSAGNAWADHVGVWHCGGYDASIGTADASGHGYAAAGTKSQSTTSGAVGNGLSLSEAIYAPDYEPVFPSGDGMTVSAWVKMPTFKSGIAVLSKYKEKGSLYDGWRIETSTDTIKTSTYQTFGVYVRENAAHNNPHKVVSRNASLSAWRQITLVKEGENWTAYDNGLKSTVFTGVAAANDERLRLGGENVMVDEVRVRQTASSAERVALEYQAMRGNYPTYGAAEKVPSGRGLIIVVQ